MQKYCDSCSFKVYETFQVCPNCGGQSFSATPQANRVERTVALPGAGNGGTLLAAQNGHVRSAGNWARLFAYLIDAVCLLILAYIMGYVLGWTFFRAIAPVDDASITAMSYVIWWIMFVLYFSLFHSSPLQATPGKLAANLRIITDKGHRLTLPRALGRALLTIGVWFAGILVVGLLAAVNLGNRAFDSLDIVIPLLVGAVIWYAPYLMLFFNVERKTLFDKICETRVIKKI